METTRVNDGNGKEVFLTKKAIRTIHLFQDGKNELIKTNRELISDTVAFLLIKSDELGLEREKTVNMATQLSYLREQLKDIEF